MRGSMAWRVLSLRRVSMRKQSTSIPNKRWAGLSKLRLLPSERQ
ncbi:hypothetical protein OESDEN_14116 [Oesophagostomum dentatum]|uniref:Uncharacterized protein n=1 Tax=Oesophagostomum dentatum TaxID=61180 RepID=A0A0B1SRN8_OESDE|nr:hypothetical protein OESDEN_14116 [Oesophagostomum dentatum]